MALVGLLLVVRLGGFNLVYTLIGPLLSTRSCRPPVSRFRSTSRVPHSLVVVALQNVDLLAVQNSAWPGGILFSVSLVAVSRHWSLILSMPKLVLIWLLSQLHLPSFPVRPSLQAAGA